MKVFRVIVSSFLIVLTLSVLSSAQTENVQIVTTNKVGFIDSRVFYDEDEGIKELVDVSKQVNSEFRSQFDELNDLIEKWVILSEELQGIYPKNEEYVVGKYPQYDSKLKESEKLLKEWQQKAEAIKKPYGNRKYEMEYSVKAKIRLVIRQFTQDKGYIAIVDKNEIKDSSDYTTIFEGASNVTREFIEFYNSLQAEK
jgi:Skp family chaperone for outer membrane proteins